MPTASCISPPILSTQTAGSVVNRKCPFVAPLACPKIETPQGLPIALSEDQNPPHGLPGRRARLPSGFPPSPFPLLRPLQQAGFLLPREGDREENAFLWEAFPELPTLSDPRIPARCLALGALPAHSFTLISGTVDFFFFLFLAFVIFKNLLTCS